MKESSILLRTLVVIGIALVIEGGLYLQTFRNDLKYKSDLAQQETIREKTQEEAYAKMGQYIDDIKAVNAQEGKTFDTSTIVYRCNYNGGIGGALSYGCYSTPK